MKRILYILIILFCVSGCVTKKRCNELHPCTGSAISHTDSVFSVETTIITRDTTVYLVDSNLVRAYLGCDSLGNVYLKEIKSLRESKNLKTNITLSNNMLDVGCKIDSAAVVVSWNEKHIIQKTKVNKDTKETVIREVNKLTGWQWFQIWAARILSIIFLLIIIYIILKWKRILK